MGVLGDWGVYMMDMVYEFLELGLLYEVDLVYIIGYNLFFFLMFLILLFKFLERGDMLFVELIWYDGLDNILVVLKGYGVLEIDLNVLLLSDGELKFVKLNLGKIIYGKDLIFKGGFYGSILFIILEDKVKDMELSLLEVLESIFNYYVNFLLVCKGEEKICLFFDVVGFLS